MKIIKSSDWLISENKAGGEKFWRLHILQDNKEGGFYTQTEWFQISKTGRETKRQFSSPYYAEPTNVGRSNERNSEQQAEFEFDAVIKKQKDKGFRAKGERKNVRPMPMLAHKFTDHKKKVNFPAYIQPKLNGMRMLFDGENGWSRGNKEVIPEVIQHLKFDTGGVILDGELMLPNNQLLQESMKAIKKYRPELSSHRGEYTKRNGARTPWNHRADVRIIQSVKNVDITFDITNFGNLLNKDWGKYYFVPNLNNQNVYPLQYRSGRGVNSVPTFSFDPLNTTYQTDDLMSRWQMQVGIRVNF